MKKSILILAMLTAFQSPAQTKGHDQGGGAGGFCIEKKCMTLAEAGFRFKVETVERPVVTSKVFAAADNILKRTSVSTLMAQNLYGLTMGGVDQFVRLEVVDDKKFEMLKNQYLKLLQRNGYSTVNFKLFAFSDAVTKITYLLPAYDDLDSDASRAKILIHEGVVRRTGSVQLALELDIAIENILTGTSDFAGTATAYGKILPQISNAYLPAAGALRDYFNTHKSPLSVPRKYYKDQTTVYLDQAGGNAEIYDLDKTLWLTLRNNKIRIVKNNVGPYQTPAGAGGAVERADVCMRSVGHEFFWLEADGYPYAFECFSKRSWSTQDLFLFF